MKPENLVIDHIKTAEQLGVAIKRLRKSKSMSQSDLAKMMNMRQPTISSIESGKGTLDSLFKIIQALQINLIASNQDQATINESHQIKDMIKEWED